MSRYLIHPLTSVETLLVPSRASRPNAFGEDGDIRCPFCPGNESDTPATIDSTPENGSWKVRVFPNLYPITDESVDGVHEVIVDTRLHDVRPAALALDQIEALLEIYANRFNEARVNGFAYAALFKNAGAAAGQSLEHPHTQFVALRSLPRSIASRVADATCAICADVADESLLIASEDNLCCFAPAASRLPFEMMIAASDHETDPVAFLQRKPLASLLSKAMKAIDQTFGTVAFNLIIDHCKEAPQHAAIALIPRLTTLGGFELATNVLINVVDPADAAARYRGLV